MRHAPSHVNRSNELPSAEAGGGGTGLRWLNLLLLVPFCAAQ